MSKSVGEMPAFPFKWDHHRFGTMVEKGLTKRELIATQILSGWAAKGIASVNGAPGSAVELADKLLSELEKKSPPCETGPKGESDEITS